jgi:hypothetical protein
MKPFMKPYIHTENTNPSADSYYGLMSDIAYHASRVAAYANKCEALSFEPSHDWYDPKQSPERMLQLNLERVTKAVAALLAHEPAAVQTDDDFDEAFDHKHAAMQAEIDMEQEAAE